MQRPVTGLMSAAVLAYRYSLKPFIGAQCRHLPTCSDYALTALDRHGGWVGGWLIAARLWRCRPGGTDGFDPVPRKVGVAPGARRWLTPWRMVQWTACTPADQGVDRDW
ncbi:MAG: membrane protein insertion efficiency factor YidD [Pseudomonadota bacterium]